MQQGCLVRFDVFLPGAFFLVLLLVLDRFLRSALFVLRLVGAGFSDDDNDDDYATLMMAMMTCTTHVTDLKVDAVGIFG